MKASQLFFCCAGVLAAASATAVIDPSLTQRFLGGSGSTQNVMVSFTQGIQSVIQQINRMNFSSAGEKRTVLTNAQEIFTNGVQGTLKGFLDTMGVKYESFWINNKMVIQNVNSGLVNAISNIPGVAKIEKEPVIHLNPMQNGESEDPSNGSSNSSVEWGIDRIRADQVWGSFKGKGIVVANIDTGVRYTHESLRARWRPLYGWFDPYLYTSRPNDFNGHGTHTMGTIAGANGIGVAPEVTWISCKGCTTLTCAASQLFKCGQWVQCPTNWLGFRKNCDMAPQIVSNSWGGGNGDSWYDEVILSWQASGIIPVFAIGNAGSKCGTANSPGDRPNVIAVGSTESNNQISSFSSLGPTKRKDVDFKPDIAAPGGKVRSAWFTGDKAYHIISGTSMACPHVSGVIALMKQKNFGINYEEVYRAITSSANTQSLDNGNTTVACGDISPSTYPNNVFGYGLIDALNSVNAISASSSEE